MSKLLKEFYEIINEAPETEKTTLVKTDDNYRKNYSILLARTVVSFDELLGKISNNPGLEDVVTEVEGLFEQMNTIYKASLEKLNNDDKREVQGFLRELKNSAEDDVIIDLQPEPTTREKKELAKEKDIDVKNEVDEDKDNSEDIYQRVQKYLRK